MKKVNGTRQLAGTDKQIFEDRIDYIRHRPHIMLGSCENERKTSFFYDEKGNLELMEVAINPAFNKIISEIIDNSIDEALRTDFKYANKIDVIYDGERITITDNGRGIEVVKDDVLDMWLPEIIFSHLESGSNYDDESGQESIGQNGVGSVLTNIFSTSFNVFTGDGKNTFKQQFSNASKNKNKPQISKGSKRGTEISFIPDYDYFKLTKDVKNNIEKWVVKRLKDLSFVYPQIRFKYNKKNISVKKPKDLLKTLDDHIVFDESEKVRLALFYHENDYNMAFVNGLNVPQGSHVNYVINRVVNQMREHINKKHKIDVKPSEIRNYIGVVLSLRFPKPKFNHQTKEELSSNPNDFAAIIDEVLTDRFINKVIKHENIVPNIVATFSAKEKLKNQSKVNKALGKREKIAKYIPPMVIDRTKNVLVIAEGDSAASNFIPTRTAKSLYGMIPIGKIMNVHGVDELKIISSDKIKDLMKIIGLEFGKPATNIKFAKIKILADQDEDGNSIAGLFLNFFYRFWPELFENGVISRILTPLAIIHINKKEKEIYSLQELKKYELNSSEEYTVKYYKGLGALSEEQYAKYLYDGQEIVFNITDDTSDTIELVYGEDPNPRKEWLADSVA